MMIKNLFGGVYNGVPVLVTGHTGFKGSWLTAWLTELGADVIGYSLEEPPTLPCNYEISGLEAYITDIRGDVRDFAHLESVIHLYRPRIIFHLAAQPIVLHSVDQPKETIEINTLGTVNLLEAVRRAKFPCVIVCITTDKVYKNKNWVWGYRETDELGGYDPYGASKAMAELAIMSYQQTFFPPDQFEDHEVAISSVRAGNVIGGGDFADFRIVPDCMNALVNGQPIGIRNPMSVRPWQHVLEPLSGYLWLAVNMLNQGAAFSDSWNFGPLEHRGITTQVLAEKLIDLWGEGQWHHIDPGYAKVETGLLRLSWEKAASRLNWSPVYNWEKSLEEIVLWYKAYKNSQNMRKVCIQHIESYTAEATRLGLAWTK